VGTIPPNNKFIERRNIYTPDTKMHDRSLSLLGTNTSIHSGGARLA